MKYVNKTIKLLLIVILCAILFAIGANAGYNVCSRDYKNRLSEYFRNEYADKETRDYMNNPDIQALFK